MLFSSDVRRSWNEVGMSPGLLETIFGLSHLIILLLDSQALDQSNQRPPVVRMSQKILAIGRFRF
jgi:hypothetical protein